MKVQFKKEAGKYVAAYPYRYQGFEFVYLKSNEKKTLLIENKLAIQGIWLNDKQISEIIQLLIDGSYSWIENGTPFFTVGDEIVIESYKHRGIGVYGKDGFLSNQTPDFIRSLKITE